MMRRPPRSTQGSSSAASDVYKRQLPDHDAGGMPPFGPKVVEMVGGNEVVAVDVLEALSLIHISEPTRPY